jgi:ribosomal-protein-alanine N-acetyltransferase
MMIFTEMKAEHVPQVAALEKLCFADPWSEMSIASELRSIWSYWVVAVDHGQVVGYIGSQSSYDETDIMNVAVHPDWRRRGIAESLIECLIQELKNRGSHALMLEVRASNAPATALYEKLGFRQVGLRKNYYRNPKEDALILRKEWEI